MAEEVKSEVMEEKPPVKKKNFFKSTSFKCIIVLLAIVLVCGIILTICNTIFYVSDEERLQRAISKIYGYDMTVEKVEFTKDQETQGSATILAAYKDENGDYLISSKGKGGFNGTVTCWVLVGVSEDEVTGVEKVVINTSDGETLLNSIDFLGKYADAEYEDGFTYTTSGGFVTSGATLSSTAINNAVNGAVSFVKYVCLGETNPYAAYSYYSYVDMENSAWSTTSGTTTYNIVTKTNGAANSFSITITVGSAKTILSFDITTNGSTNSYENNMYDTTRLVGKTQTELETLLNSSSGDSDTIYTGATKSNTLCVESALFAVANYDVCSAADKAAGEDVTSGGAE